MNEIILKDITKRFDGHTVFEHLTLTLPVGYYSVMGPSGCGKTTLLRILAGLCAPDEGTVTGVPREIGFVFQENRLCEHLTVLRNLKLVTGHRITERELLSHLDAVGLSDCARMPVASLSGGMKRRVAIVRAVCVKPKLLLLDEAFTGLDTVCRAEVIDYIRAHTEGVTVLSVTHHADEVPLMGGHVLTLPTPSVT